MFVNNLGCSSLYLRDIINDYLFSLSSFTNTEGGSCSPCTMIEEMNEIKGDYENGANIKDIIRKCICNRHGHQYCISKAAVNEATEALSGASYVGKKYVVSPFIKGNKINNDFADFEHLYDTIMMLIGGIKGIGPLTVYDTAKRIGHILTPPIYPELYVYLSAGTLDAAKALLGRNDLKFREPICMFMPYFGTLPSIFIEDILCVYKDNFITGDHKTLSKKLCLNKVKSVDVDFI